MDSGRDHYAILGVPTGAPRDEVRAAYLKLARLLHPDRYQSAGPPERALADRRMREVNAAWEVLGDPGRRARFDRERVPPDDAAEVFRRSVAEQGGSAGFGISGDDDDDEFDPEMSRAAMFLFRRGPIAVAVAVAIGIFIGSAYATSNDDGPSRPTAPSTTVCVPTAADLCMDN